jgi:hypothetical protein
MPSMVHQAMYTTGTIDNVTCITWFKWLENSLNSNGQQFYLNSNGQQFYLNSNGQQFYLNSNGQQFYLNSNDLELLTITI